MKVNVDVNLKINLKINKKDSEKKKDIKEQIESRFESKLNSNGAVPSSMKNSYLPEIKNNSKGMRYHLNIRHQKYIS